jgi:hypothetical protein
MKLKKENHDYKNWGMKTKVKVHTYIQIRRKVVEPIQDGVTVLSEGPYIPNQEAPLKHKYLFIILKITVSINTIIELTAHFLTNFRVILK